MLLRMYLKWPMHMPSRPKSSIKAPAKWRHQGCDHQHDGTLRLRVAAHRNRPCTAWFASPRSIRASATHLVRIRLRPPEVDDEIDIE